MDTFADEAKDKTHWNFPPIAFIPNSADKLPLPGAAASGKNTRNTERRSRKEYRIH